MTENICDNALDLANGLLKVEDNWPRGTYCQWLISAQDDDANVVLEFHDFTVRNTSASIYNTGLSICVSVCFRIYKKYCTCLSSID